MATKFIVLYTHQKTKKRKVWQDGTLVLSSDGKSGSLKNDKQENIAKIKIKNPPSVGDDLESPKYLIQIDGVYAGTALPVANDIPVSSEPDSTADLSKSNPLQPKFRCKGPVKSNTPIQSLHKDSNEAMALVESVTEDNVPRKKKKFCVPRRVGSVQSCDSTSFSEIGDCEYGEMQCEVVEQDQNGVWHTVSYNQPQISSENTSRNLSNSSSRMPIPKNGPRVDCLSNIVKSKSETNYNTTEPIKLGNKTIKLEPNKEIRSAKEVLEILKQAKSKILENGQNLAENNGDGNESQTICNEPNGINVSTKPSSSNVNSIVSDDNKENAELKMKFGLVIESDQNSIFNIEEENTEEFLPDFSLT